MIVHHKFIMLLVLVLGICNKGLPQKVRECGTITPAEKKTVLPPFRLQAINALPHSIKVVMHIWRNDDGTMPACSDDSAMARYRQMVEFYRPHNICFNLAQIFHHNNSNVNTMDASSDFSEMAAQNHGGVLNINIHLSLMDGDDVLNGIAYSVVTNVVSLNGTSAVMNNNLNITVMPHEVGHALGLYHTFETWWGAESVARTGSCADCVDDGDLLCDTEADPHDPDVFEINDYTAFCIYTNPPWMLDDCNEPYRPDPRNIMAYGDRWCRSLFTPGQGARMRALILQEPILQNITAPDLLNVNHTSTSGTHYFLAKDLVNSSGTLSNTALAKSLYKAKVIQFNPGTELKPSAGGYSWAVVNTDCQ